MARTAVPVMLTYEYNRKRLAICRYSLRRCNLFSGSRTKFDPGRPYIGVSFCEAVVGREACA